MQLHKNPISPFRKPIIWLFKKRYEAVREKNLSALSKNQPNLLTEYQTQTANIHDLVMNTKYWHGTGRRQYKTNGDSKYDGVEHKETFDVLETIAKAGGLIPRYDPWFEKYVKTSHTISVANQWCYGKMYAHYHLYEKDQLRFEIAPAKFWYRVLIWIQLTENYCKMMFGFLILYTFSSTLQKQGKIWMATFRSDLDKKWPFWEILTAQSDIVDNYGLLFGIRSELQTVKVMRLASFLESRTDQAIPFEKMTFMAVPYKYVAETEQYLVQRNCTLPIIPLEFLEIYMAQYSLKEIITQDYL